MARFSAWWQVIRKHRSFVIYFVVMIVFVIAFFIVAQLIFLGYWPDWTGFNGYNKVTTAHTISGPNAGATIQTEEYQPGKGLWDWLQLLIIPAVLAVGGYLFNLTVSRNEQKAAASRDQIERETAANRDQAERDIATDNQQESALQEYIDKISELLLNNKLRESAEDSEVRKIARVRTLTVLPRLDKVRKKSVLQLLYESGLLDKNKHIVDLTGADLSQANLRGAKLSSSDLSGANLIRADLSQADLSGADLIRADLSGAILVFTDLRGANLRGVKLFGANLTYADLRGANLTQTMFSKADLSGAYLDGADLSGSDLGRVRSTTTEQLKQAKSRYDAIMPDGSIHP